VEQLEKYTLGDILHASDRLDAIINGDALPERSLLLLTMLAQNCAQCYDSQSNTLDESDDFTDMLSFDEYFRSLSDALRAAAMAPLYPRRRLDFVVLYSYHLIKKDIARGNIPDALSGYMVKALNAITEENENA